LRETIEALEEKYAEAVRCLESARGDSQLHDDDGVVEGFAELVDAIEHAYAAVRSVRDHVETLDALHSPRGEKLYTNGDELIGDILAGR
jgi:hypothetical protein